MIARAEAAYLGLAIGDALGATVEFLTPREIARQHGVHRELRGGGWLNLKPGQTTFDGRFTLLPTCCLGNCDKGPNMMIDEDTHAHLTPEGIPELLERYK